MASAPVLSGLLIRISGQIDDGAHLGAEDTKLHRPAEQRVEPRHGFHQADAVVLFLEPLVDLQEGDDPTIFPQESRNGLFLCLPVHCAFEQDGCDDLGAGEGRGGHDAHAHFMHEPEHLGIAAIGAVRNAIEAQGSGRRSTALIKCCDKAVLPRDLPRHLVIRHDRHPRVGPDRYVQAIAQASPD
jgi:hypothetical protein